MARPVSPSPGEATCEGAILESADPHRAAGTRRMHKARLADIDAHMVHEQARAHREKHQITRQQIGLVQRRALLTLLQGSSGQFEAQLLVHEQREPRAVEALRRIATVTVRLAQLRRGQCC